MTLPECRFCASPLSETFADLGMSPLANSYVPATDARAPETFYPLHAYVCSQCRLVQLEAMATPEHIFKDYLYFSSYSDSWLDHCRRYASSMIERFKLGKSSQVVEVASNDGYLLQFFIKSGVPSHGVEPAANVAAEAVKKGVETTIAFFGAETARKLAAAGKSADLIAANNVLAHVPEINDFVTGFRLLLKPSGVVTIEFPHLLTQMRENQFDTIYHEHFSYLSLLSAERIFSAHGLRIFDVDRLPTHGGSLRIYACRADNDSLPETNALRALRAEEAQAGLDGPEAYRAFAQQIVEVKAQLLRFLIDARLNGKLVAGYGAPAKGNTLLNYCGVKTDLLTFTVDRSPHKQGRLLPGTRIPILPTEAIFEKKPDYLFILPWNLKEEITEQMASVRDFGCKFVVAVPSLQVF